MTSVLGLHRRAPIGVQGLGGSGLYSKKLSNVCRTQHLQSPEGYLNTHLSGHANPCGKGNCNVIVAQDEGALGEKFEPRVSGDLLGYRSTYIWLLRWL